MVGMIVRYKQSASMSTAVESECYELLIPTSVVRQILRYSESDFFVPPTYADLFGDNIITEDLIDYHFYQEPLWARQPDIVRAYNRFKVLLTDRMNVERAVAAAWGVNALEYGFSVHAECAIHESGTTYSVCSRTSSPYLLPWQMTFHGGCRAIWEVKCMRMMRDVLPSESLLRLILSDEYALHHTWRRVLWHYISINI